MTPSSSTNTTMIVGTGAGPLPSLVYVQAGEQRTLIVDHAPFTIGRKTDRDLVVADARVSREHAEIRCVNGEYWIIDQGSKHGVHVNGERVGQQRRLDRNDRIEFGLGDAAYIVWNPVSKVTTAARDFLSQISVVENRGGVTSDLEKLKFFLEAARKLNTTGALEEVLVTLIDSTLRLTNADRGFVFLRGRTGQLRLAAGRTAKGEPLLDDTTISRSILEEAASGASEFLVTDTTRHADLAGRNSIVAFDLRTVICIPLRRSQKRTDESPIMGVLYVDSRLASGDMSTVGHDILHAIATEAAALVENAQLAEAEEASRRFQQELGIAASIQQRLMTVTIPEVPYARFNARNIACKDVGGDFFDVVATPDSVSLVVCDVSGKGMSAAIMASTMQGMIYAQLTAGLKLEDVASSVNKFVYQRVSGEKYATLLVARLWPDGQVEFINCGHVPPVLVENGNVRRLAEANLPVGLLPMATFASTKCRLSAGAQLVVVTDGVTEAENAAGDFFGDARLEEAVKSNDPFENIFTCVRSFCGEVALGDDCTVAALSYTG